MSIITNTWMDWIPTKGYADFQIKLIGGTLVGAVISLSPAGAFLISNVSDFPLYLCLLNFIFPSCASINESVQFPCACPHRKPWYFKHARFCGICHRPALVFSGMFQG